MQNAIAFLYFSCSLQADERKLRENEQPE